MLPLLSENYEQDNDYSLLIRSVALTNLGIYTCQAFNGIGSRPASWSATVQAIGPVYNIKPEHEEYTKYLVQPPRRPTTTEKPQYPYRPTRMQSFENQTYAPIYTTKSSYVIPRVIPLEPTTVEPSGAKFKGESHVVAGNFGFPFSFLSFGYADRRVLRICWFPFEIRDLLSFERDSCSVELDVSLAVNHDDGCNRIFLLTLSC